VLKFDWATESLTQSADGLPRAADYLGEPQGPGGLHSARLLRHLVSRQDGLHIFAAVICDAAGYDPACDTLRSLRTNGQLTLHWGAESSQSREKIIDVIASINMASVVVVGTPLNRKKRDRARAVYMEMLVIANIGKDVAHVLLEERSPSLNNRDFRLVDAICGKKLIPCQMRIDVARPSVEPMLWLPDVVAGAVGAARVRNNPAQTPFYSHP